MRVKIIFGVDQHGLQSILNEWIAKWEKKINIHNIKYLLVGGEDWVEYTAAIEFDVNVMKDDIGLNDIPRIYEEALS